VHICNYNELSSTNKKQQHKKIALKEETFHKSPAFLPPSSFARRVPPFWSCCVPGILACEVSTAVATVGAFGLAL